MKTKEACKCGLPKKWAADPNFPVEYDAVMNEFNLKFTGGSWIMQYCFRCGGKLPESKRGDQFQTPNKREERAVCKVIEQIHTVAEMTDILGKPDRITETKANPERDKIYGTRRPLRFFQYFHHWRTISLNVGENKDGTLEFSYYGSPKEKMKRA